MLAMVDIIKGQDIVMKLLEMGLTKWRIHKYCGVELPTVRNWLEGKHGVSYPNIIKLQQLYIETVQKKGLKFFVEEPIKQLKDKRELTI